MNTRFVIPAATALSIHALAFFGRPTPRHPPADVDLVPVRGCELLRVLDDPPPVLEENSGAAEEKRGEPDVARSVEPPTQPRAEAFTVPAIERDSPTVASPSLPHGPIGVPGGNRDFGPEVISSTYLDNPPRTRSQIAPVYPYEARNGGRPGEVVVEFTVDETGKVMNPRVVRSSEAVFESPTLRAIAKWRFEPGRRHGQPVRFRMAVPVQFSLND
ncbi:MAG: TonB family protein [Verrucomicrobia bacterium]|nr:TonB family protein [Verrucomicrobiota bacterium]